MRERDIFIEAVPKNAPERAAYLAAACGDDRDLRRRVEELLAEHEKEQSFFLDAPLPGVNITIDQPVQERPGSIIGPYKLLQQIGEGGMGVVYMAEQTEPVQRKVALKVIKPGMDSRQIIARFEAERQALAMMDHVNIARVLDAGTTEQGRPYFVMELVHGVPITKYCDDNRLTPRQRLELFVPVCQAIQHAHQKGIIHRDIKPSNVMVTLYDGKPVPKVIDFGVAKATEQKLTERTLFTQYGTMIGTLEYMSPEQAEMSALGVDTRSDIYSLGVLLYELLTGSTPLSSKRMKEAAYAEILRLIKEEEPPKPSTRLSDSGEALASISAQRHMEPAKLSKLMRGELDWIVMKTLEKDRNRRYETANGFAMDVQRYLNDEAVEACPPSAMYRFRKFARRNKAAIAVSGLVLFFLVLLGSGAGWAVRDRAARDAEQAQERNERRSKVAAQVELILTEVERLAKEGKWDEALTAAKRAQAALAAGTAAAEMEQRVRDRLADLELVQRLEGIRLQRSELKDGSGFDNETADRAYAAVFREYGIDVEELAVEEAAERIRSRPGVAVALTAALDDWAYCRGITKDPAGARSLTMMAQAADSDPWRRRVRTTLLQKDWKALEELAASEEVLRQPPATLVMLGAGLRTDGKSDRELEVLRKGQREYPGDFWINFQLAASLHTTKPPRLDEAIAFYRAALAARPRNSAVRTNLGNALGDNGELDEAIACYRKAIELDPKNAYAHTNLGNALSDQKKLDEAIACYKTAIELDPKDATVHNNLGNALKDQKKLDEAIASYKKAIELDPKLAKPRSNLGNALREQGKLDEAIACCRKAIELDPKFAAAHSNLGVALLEQGKVDEAIASHKKAIELDPKLALAHYNLGVALDKQGKLDEAIAYYRKAVELKPDYAAAQSNLGAALADKGEVDEAIASYKKAIELDPKLAVAHSNLGNALNRQGKLDEAIACCRKAIELDPKYAAPHYNLGNALYGQGKLDEAIACYRKAIELDPKLATVHSNLGTALSGQGKLDEAIACCRKAIELDPKLAGAHYNLGIDLKAKGKLDEAMACFRKAIELDPKDPAAHDSLGSALREQGKLDEAIASHKKAIELDPKLALAQSNLGVALHKQGKLDEAIACFRKAIELDPKYTGAQSNLGIALARQGKLDEAIACYRKAIELQPDFADASNHLAWLLATAADAKLRDGKHAVELAKKAVELKPKNASYWQTLGVAQYRVADWRAAIAALEKVKELGSPGDSMEWFPLAMAHWQLGEKEAARKWYDQAALWMEKNKPEDEELKRFRAEATELLGVKEGSRE